MSLWVAGLQSEVDTQHTSICQFSGLSVMSWPNRSWLVPGSLISPSYGPLSESATSLPINLCVLSPQKTWRCLFHGRLLSSCWITSAVLGSCFTLRESEMGHSSWRVIAGWGGFCWWKKGEVTADTSAGGDDPVGREVIVGVKSVMSSA